MAKSTKTNKITNAESAKQSNEHFTKKEKIEKRTLCYLASKADHIIEVQYNGQITYLQPYGKIKVIREQIKLNPNDAKYLTFIKI